MKRLASIAICSILLVPCVAQPKDKILVIGVTSKEVSEIDGRLLREETMRRFHNDGYAIVPVMELERELRERNTLAQIVSEKEIFHLAASFDARWTVRGTLSSAGVERKFVLYVYDTAKSKRHSSDVTVPDGEFPEIIPALSSRIAEKAEELIRSEETGKE